MPQTANNRPSRTCKKYSQKQSIGSKTVKNSLKPSKLVKNGWKCPQSHNPRIPWFPDPPIPKSLNPPIPQSPNPPIPQSHNPTIPQSPNPSILQSFNPPCQSPNPLIPQYLGTKNIWGGTRSQTDKQTDRQTHRRINIMNRPGRVN